MAKLNGEKVNNARYIDQDVIQTIMSAGINPSNGKPLRGGDFPLKQSIKELLTINDEQAAINTFVWYNLPEGLDGNLIERILYYRGQGMLFYMESYEKFFFLPFTMGSRGIDVYGRFINTTPLPFNGTVASDGDRPLIKGMEYDVLYDIPDLETTVDITKCVLLSDFSKQISQTNISRKILNGGIIDLESDILPFLRTNLLNATGVSGMRVQNEDEQSNVEDASKNANAAALRGKKWIPIIGTVDFQDLTGAGLANVDTFLMSMQSIDNYRLQTHGEDSGGIFQKQAHMLESENEMNARKSSFVLQDRLQQRQRFCDIANSNFGLGIWCDINEDTLSTPEEQYLTDDEDPEGFDDEQSEID